jgi:hypothetical protein
MDSAKHFYREYDQFKEMIDYLNQNMKESIEGENFDTSFDFNRL